MTYLVVDSAGFVAGVSLLLACGCPPDRASAAFELIQSRSVPHDVDELIAMVNDAIERVRS